MFFDFDLAIDRSASDSYKWNRYRGRDIVPAWVADADFQSPPQLLEAIRARVDHGVLGYTNPIEYRSGKEAVALWLQRQYGWDIDTDWVVWMPGVVTAFHIACRAFCEPGDKVLVQTPNYPQILKAPALNHLQRCEVPTYLRQGRWTLDLNVLEDYAADPRCKLFILCNPMNPCGSVFSAAELAAIAAICARHDVMLCSDEIHADLIIDEGAVHIPAGSLAPLRERSVTLMSAAKTFNIAGLSAAFAVIPDANLRARYSAAAMGIVPWVNILGLVATEAAFRHGGPWHAAQLQYLRANCDLLVSGVNAIGGLRCVRPQATFLAWIDASGLGVDDVQAVFERCGVGPSAGADFGAPQFARINFACPQRTVQTMIERLQIGLGSAG